MTAEPALAAKPRYDARPCKECKTLFYPYRIDQLFHTTACKDKWFLRARNRGQQIYEMAMEWRRHRGRKGTPGEGTLSEIAHLVDGWLDADKTAAEKRG